MKKLVAKQKALYENHLQPVEPIKKIVVIDLGGIGDLLLSTPALKVLRELYPQAILTCLVSPLGKEILQGLSFLHRIVVFPISEVELASSGIWLRWIKLFQLFSISLSLRRESFDMVINLRPLHSRGSAIKMALFMALIGAKRRIGRDTKGRGFFLTHRVSEEGLEGRHEIDYVMRIIHQLGGKTKYPIEITIGPEEEIQMEKLLLEEGIRPQDRLVVFHPGAPFDTKRWPLERFIAVAKALRQKAEAKIVVIGGKEEISLGKAFQEALHGEAVSLCGKTTVKGLCVLFKRCSLLVTNDSGPMHLAAYMGTPLVAIFHSGTFRYFPQGDKEKCVVFGNEDQTIFWEKHQVRDRGVLDTIPEEKVLQAALTLLKRFGDSMEKRED